ncbi:MAG: galactokinase, partial [Nocardioidaceae bacterium]
QYPARRGRVNLIGEHTDYNDGFVLPLALSRRVLAAVAPRGDGALELRSAQSPDQPRRISVSELAPGHPSGWAAYPAGVVWALRETGHAVGGAEIMVDADLPAGSGLASSAALECAVAVALAELSSLDISPNALATAAQRAENDFVGVPTGIMDQTAALLCTSGRALFLDTRSMETRQVPLDLETAGMRLLVIDTKAPHRLVEGEYADRRRSCEEAARLFGVRALRDVSAEELADALTRLPDETLRGRVRHVVTENTRVLAAVELLDEGGLDRVGALLTQSHVSLRDDYEVSSPELDVAVEASVAAGALGARMTGGGFGGCAIALVERDAVDGVAEAVAQAYGRQGFAAPETFTVVPAAGARRVV